jgi:hypothetical protein
LDYPFQKKSGNDGFTRSISTSSKHQVGDEKASYMTVSSLVLEQVSYVAGTGWITRRLRPPCGKQGPDRTEIEPLQLDQRLLTQSIIILRERIPTFAGTATSFETHISYSDKSSALLPFRLRIPAYSF